MREEIRFAHALGRRPNLGESWCCYPRPRMFLRFRYDKAVCKMIMLQYANVEAAFVTNVLRRHANSASGEGTPGPFTDLEEKVRTLCMPARERLEERYVALRVRVAFDAADRNQYRDVKTLVAELQREHDRWILLLGEYWRRLASCGLCPDSSPEELALLGRQYRESYSVD